MDWFSVDKEGLAKLLERRGPSFAVLELIQNAWDQNVSRVDCLLEPIPNRSYARLVVKDDDPNGFSDLSHAWTLFAESNKKGDPTKRGRFNLGEKLVLALCETAEISTTTGTVIFDQKGRRKSRRKTERGSVFEGIIKMSRADLEATEVLIQSLIPPHRIYTTYGGSELLLREPLASFEVTLPTEKSDEDGNLRPTRRKTMVEVYEPYSSEDATIYEMGIPVVETGDRWHVNVQQKIPLNMDRDNVTPAYLKAIRVHVLNAMADKMDDEDSDGIWITDALGHKDIEPDALKTAIRKRFGDKAVAFDPSDHEANQRAVSKGYTVIHGRSLPSKVWSNVREHEVVKPAGKAFPTPKAMAGGPGAEQVEFYSDDELTPEMKSVRQYTMAIANISEVYPLNVQFKKSTQERHWAACFSRGVLGPPSLTFNVPVLGKRWFRPSNRASITDLVIHELAHNWSSSHLDDAFHEACTKIGGKLVNAAVERPYTFKL